MRPIHMLTITLLLWLLTSCANIVEFPVSPHTPAADITAKTRKQGTFNYLVTITANNLADSERLDPPKKVYVIWAVSEAGVVRNVGHFVQQNAIRSIYKASFPYKVVEIFITAEDEQGPCQPVGIEITRTKL